MTVLVPVLLVGQSGPRQFSRRQRRDCALLAQAPVRFDTLKEHAGFTRQSHRLRCYVLIGYPKDTFDAATERLTDISRIGFTPMAMLWRPETPSQQRWAPSAEWRGFQRRWARPAIIHRRIA